MMLNVMHVTCISLLIHSVLCCATRRFSPHTSPCLHLFSRFLVQLLWKDPHSWASKTLLITFIMVSGFHFPETVVVSSKDYAVVFSHLSILGHIEYIAFRRRGFSPKLLKKLGWRDPFFFLSWFCFFPLKHLPLDLCSGSELLKWKKRPQTFLGIKC